MIVGEFLADSDEAVLPLTLRNPLTGAELEVSAVIDTGFTAFLLLTHEAGEALGLSPQDTQDMVLADESVVEAARCRVTVVWDGRERTVLAHVATARSPLVGVKMLRGSLLTVEFVPGGSVTIERA
jgi:clan AA aspartic protease